MGTKEEKAVTDLFGDSAKAVIEWVKNLLNVMFSGLDARIKKIEDRCDELERKLATPASSRTAPKAKPATKSSKRPSRVSSGSSLRDWRWLEWIFAIFGLFVGLLVAKFTFVWIHWLADEPFAWLANMLVFLWWLTLAAAGFFLGGEIVSRVRASRT